MSKTKGKKILSLLLTLCMVLTLLPMSAFAAAGGEIITAGSKETLTQAIEKAGDGDTIRLTAEITLTDTVEINKNVTLDLNGQTLSRKVQFGSVLTIANGADVTITGSGTVKNTDEYGTGITVGSRNPAEDNFATLTLTGGATVDGGYTGITVAKYAHLDIQEAAVKGTSSALSGQSTSVLTVSGDKTYINGSWKSSWGNDSVISGGYFTVFDGTRSDRTNIYPTGYKVVDNANKSEGGVTYNYTVAKMTEEEAKVFAAYVVVGDGKDYDNDIQALHARHMNDVIYIQGSDVKVDLNGVGQSAAVEDADDSGLSNAFVYRFNVLEGAKLTVTATAAKVMKVVVDPASKGTATVSLTPADGYEQAKDTAKGVYFVNVKDITYVAEVSDGASTKKVTTDVLDTVLGDPTYNRAMPNTTKIKLLADYSTETSIIPRSDDITLDLNGHTYTYNGTNAAIISQMGYKVTLSNSGEAGKGILAAPKANLAIALGSSESSDRSGKAVIGTGVTVNNTVAVFNKGSELTVNGTISAKGPAISSNGSSTTDDGTSMGGTVVTINEGAVVKSENSMAIYQPQNGTLTVKGGEITGKAGIVARAGSVQISGGKITANGTQPVEVTGVSVPASAVVADKNDSYREGSLKVNITGGEFKAAEKQDAVIVSTKGTADGEGDGTTIIMNISGGKFSSDVKNNYVVKGYKDSDATEDSGTKDTTWVVIKDETKVVKDPVAEIERDGKPLQFETLADAVQAAQSGETIKLVKDEVTVEAYVTIKQDVTIDLNGKTLKRTGNGGTVFYVTGNKLTVTDNSAGKKGTVTNPSSTGNQMIVVTGDDSELEIQGGAFTQGANSTVSVIVLDEGATGVISGGTIEGKLSAGDDANVSAISVQGEKTSLTVKGDAVIKSNEVGIDVYGKASLSVEGGTIEANSFGIATNGAADNVGAVIAVSGGTVTSKEAAGMYLPAVDGETTVSGNAKITGVTGIEIRAGKLTVSGTPAIEGTGKELTVKANGSGMTTAGAGIAVSQHNTKDDIDVQIDGGTITGGGASLSVANPQENTDTAEQVAVTVGESAALKGTVSIDEAYQGETSPVEIAEGTIEDETLKNIAAATVKGKDSADDPFEGAYEIGEPAWKTNGGAYVNVPIIVSELQKHKNGNGNDGYWVGITLTAPTDAKSFKVGGAAKREDLALSENATNFSDDDHSLSIYIDAKPEKGAAAKQWLIVEWFGEGSPEVSLGTTTYYLDLTEVSVVPDAERTLTVSAAPLHDVSGLFTDEQLYVADSYKVEKGANKADGQHITVTAEGLKPHMAGDEDKTVAYCYGVEINAPEGYTMYSIAEDGTEDAAVAQLHGANAGKKGLVFYGGYTRDDWTRSDALEKTQTLTVTWTKDGGDTLVETYVLDITLGVYVPDAAIGEFGFKANPALADEVRGGTDDSDPNTMWVKFEEKVATPGYWLVLSHNGTRYAVAALENADFADTLKDGISTVAFSFTNWLKDSGIELEEGDYTISLYFIPGVTPAAGWQKNPAIPDGMAGMDSQTITLTELTIDLGDGKLSDGQKAELAGKYGISGNDTDGYTMFAATTDTTAKALGIDGLAPTAPSGQKFTGWTVADGKITAQYEKVNVPSNPPTGGGTVTPSTTVKTESAKNGSFTVSDKYASAGKTVKVTPKANEGYVVDQVTVTDKNGNNITVTQNADGTYSFVMPAKAAQPVTVKVTFKEEEQVHVCPSEKYTDVNTAAWYHEGVDYAIKNGLMEGVGSNLFAPDATTTRAMVVTILYRLDGEPAVTKDIPFADVPVGQWYSNAINWAAANGIVDGYGNGKFGPDDTITREQMAAILYRYASYKGYSVSDLANLTGYTDATSVSEWASTAMRWAVAEGLIEGTGAATLSPSGDSTRAQVATILMRFCEGVVK